MRYERQQRNNTGHEGCSFANADTACENGYWYCKRLPSAHAAFGSKGGPYTKQLILAVRGGMVCESECQLTATVHFPQSIHLHY